MQVLKHHAQVVPKKAFIMQQKQHNTFSLGALIVLYFKACLPLTTYTTFTFFYLLKYFSH